MSFYRTTLLAIATLFTIGMTSVASAGCGGCGGCGWGGGGWGGWGWGGGCGVPYAPVTYAAPVPAYAVPVPTYAQPLAPAPIWVRGCGCGAGLLGYLGGPVVSSPVFVVNQGPEYSGPGIMEPFRTYSPSSVYGPRFAYPYFAHPLHGARYAYGPHVYYRR